jgi:hypothetical protein
MAEVTAGVTAEVTTAAATTAAAIMAAATIMADTTTILGEVFIRAMPLVHMD